MLYIVNIYSVIKEKLPNFYYTFSLKKKIIKANMFRKKILSLIGFLFAATTSLVKADNALTTTCTPVDGQTDACTEFTHYCITAENKIYGMGSSCNSVILEEGVHVFEVITAESNVKKIDLTDNDASVTSGNDGKLSVYVCDKDKKCAISAGYVKVGNSDTFKITSTSSETYGVSSDEVSCNSSDISNIGSLVTTSTGKVVCLATGKELELQATTTSGDYFLGTDALASGSPFNDLNTSDLTLSGIAIKTTQRAIVFDSVYNVVYECNDSDNLKLTDRLTNLCEGTDCDKYYTCTKGICDEQTNACPRGDSGTEASGSSCDPSKLTSTGCNTNGFYIHTTTDGVFTTAGPGDLYSCTGGTCDKIETPTQVGYLWNAAFDSSIKEHTAPFIQCSSESCQTIAVSKTSCGSGADGQVAKDGELFTDDQGTSYSICLDASEATGISLKLDNLVTTDTPYFMSVANASNIFDLGSGSTTFVIVNVKKHDILLSTATDTALYKYTDENYKIFTKQQATTETTGVCKKNGTLIEFIHLCTDEDGYDASASYYTKGTSKTISGFD